LSLFGVSDMQNDFCRNYTLGESLYCLQLIQCCREHRALRYQLHRTPQQMLHGSDALHFAGLLLGQQDLVH